jgi:hypothetical protein
MGFGCKQTYEIKLPSNDPGKATPKKKRQLFPLKAFYWLHIATPQKLMDFKFSVIQRTKILKLKVQIIENEFNISQR